jgi:hypothetical protein
MTLLAIRWIKQWKVADDRIAWVNVNKLNASWQHDRGFYFARHRLSKVALWGRYYGVKQWVISGRKMWIPHIALHPNGRVSFTDGRHRFAWIRDHGAHALPVSCPSEQLAEIKRRFGSRSRKTRVRV